MISKKTKEYSQCSVDQTAASTEEDRHANFNIVIPMQDAYWKQLDSGRETLTRNYGRTKAIKTKF